MNRIFLWISGSMILGILSSYYIHFNTNLVFILFIIMILYSFYNILREKLNNIQIIIIFFLLAIILESFAAQSKLLTYGDMSQDYSAIVKDIVEETPQKKKYIVEIDRVGSRKIQGEKALISFLREEALDIGWRVDFSGKLKEPSRNTNPKLFNYREYLLSKGIYTIGSVKDYNINKIDSTSSFSDSLKRATIKRVDNLYDSYLSPRNRSIIKSMVLGDSTYVGEEDLKAYRDLGLAHILAISGLHIGIISGFLLFLFSRLILKRRLNIGLTLTFIWVYGFVVGFPPSIVRANIMVSLLLYSQVFHEPYDIINSIFFAMFILLVGNPYSIFSIGFILSFLATLSLVILSPGIKAIFYPYDNKLTKALAPIIGVQIGLFPVMAYYFNRIALLALVGNLLIIPILSMAIVLGFSIFFIEFVFPPLNLFLAYFLNLILDFQFFLVDFIAGFSFKELKIGSPHILTIVLYYLLILVIFKVIKIDRLDKIMVRIISSYLIIFVLVNFTIIALDEKMEVHFIDVGQGDCALIRNSGYDYLIDTGGSLFGTFDIGENITLPYLEKLGVKRLKGLFISHFHEDHYQGLYALLGEVAIDGVYSAYIPQGNPILEAIDKESIPFMVLESGDRISLGHGAYMDTIWSGENRVKNENNMSLVSILNFKDHRLLFTGDMEREVEGEILDYLSDDIDIIKVPHHGSDTSSTSALLEKIRPEFGVISLGRNNMYNHPSDQVLRNYEDVKTQIYRTDQDGMVRLVLGEKTREIEGFLTKKVNWDFLFLYYSLYFMVSYILIRLYYHIERRKDFEL